MSGSVLYLMRHGKTDANIPGILRDHNVEVPLNEVGKKESREVGEYFKGKEVPVIIYSSPSERAKQTGKIISEILNQPLFIDYDLRSWDYGSLDLEEELIPFQKQWGRSPPAGEPYKVFVERFKKCLSKHWLAREPKLLITHSRNIYLLQWWVEELPEIPVSGGPTGQLYDLKTKLKG